ncbi:MAG: MBL fold metallo-hydrolase, partial [Bacteroidota bacterium]
EQVILTHEHFDHAGGLKYILKEFKPSVLAAAPYPGVTQRTYDGMQVKIGDCHATIFHTPGHSNDSICIYCEAERTIFSGDTPLNIKSPGGSYSKEFLSILEKLNELKIERIYSGHDHPVIERCGEIIERSLKNVRNSIIV